MKWLQKLLEKKDRFGFKTDQNGIYARYLREKAGWDPHLAHSKAEIISAVKTQKAKVVAILGSGWLLDVPIDFLIEKCSHIYLIDWVHPPQVVHKYRNVSKITWITADITQGIVHDLAQMKPQKLEPEAHFLTKGLIATQKKFGLLLNPDPELWVSLNLLNQLDGIPCDYIREKWKLSDSQLIPLRKHIQQSHFDTLSELPSLLICDCDEYLWNQNEWKFHKSLIHIELPSRCKTNEWIWDFDHSGHYHQNQKVRFKVRSYKL